MSYWSQLAPSCMAPFFLALGHMLILFMSACHAGAFIYCSFLNLCAKATWPSSCSTTYLCPKLAQDMPEPIPAFLAMHHFEASELQESFLGSVVVSHGCSKDMMQPFRLLKHRMRWCFTYVTCIYIYIPSSHICLVPWRGKCRSFPIQAVARFPFPRHHRVSQWHSLVSHQRQPRLKVPLQERTSLTCWRHDPDLKNLTLQRWSNFKEWWWMMYWCRICNLIVDINMPLVFHLL